MCFDVTRRDDLRELLLQPPEEPKEGEEGEGAEPEEEVVYKYVPPEPKEWVSQGSEKEILEESVMESRGKVGSFHKIFPTLDSLSIISPPPPPPPSNNSPSPPPRITPLFIIIMYIYHALINTLSVLMILINLNTIFYARVEHSSTKTIYVQCYMGKKRAS